MCSGMGGECRDRRGAASCFQAATAIHTLGVLAPPLPPGVVARPPPPPGNVGGVGAADGSGNQQAASPTRPLTHFHLPPAHFHPRPPGASLAFDLHHLAAAPHPHPRSAVGRRRRRRGRPGDRGHRRTRRRGRRGLLVHQGAILTMATLTMLPLLRLSVHGHAEMRAIAGGARPEPRASVQ